MTTTVASRPIPHLREPELLQMLKSVFTPISYLDKTRDRLGDVFYCSTPAVSNFLIIGNPEGIETVFNLPADAYECASSNQLVSPIFGQNSLLLLDGAPHQQRRKIMMPPFHGKSIQAFGETMVQVTQQVTSQWQPQQTLIIHQEMQEITLRVILKAIFGLKDSDRYDKLRRLLSEWLDAFNDPFQSLMLFLPGLQQDWGTWSPWGKFCRRKQRIYDLLLAEIRDRRGAPLGNDVLSLLLASHDEQGKALSDEVLLDELMTMLFAGHETTASTLAWTFYWIHRLPEVKAKLLDELARTGEDTDLVTVSKLPYLTAVCNETLRLNPVVLFTFGRVLKKPISILGETIPVGTMLAPSIYLAHQQADCFPEPKAFKPERFLDRTYSPYEFLPFGGGSRRCLGYAFAQFEMKIVLATILKKYTLEPIDDHPVKPTRRGITLMPKNGIPMRVVALREEGLG